MKTEFLTAFLTKAAALIAVFLSPLAWKLGGTGALVFTDTLLALVLIAQDKLKWSGKAFARTFHKSIIYFAVIILGYIVEVRMLPPEDTLPITSAIILLVIVRESKSIDEKIKLALGYSFLDFLFQQFRKFQGEKKQMD